MNLHDLYYEIKRNGIDAVFGLLSLSKILIHRFKIEIDHELLDKYDILVYTNDFERLKELIKYFNIDLVIEISPLCNLESRCIWINGLPHASIEDLILAIPYNLDKKWYISIIKQLCTKCKFINWSFVKDIAIRLGILSKINQILKIQ